MVLIETKNITKIYTEGEVETPALLNADLSIEKGEFVAVMGPSGSGKSTLLHILGFLDEATAGTYHFEGREVSRYSEDEKAHIRNTKLGFVFQAFNLLARTSVLENVLLPLLYSDVPEKEWEALARAAIEKVGLSHRTEHHPAQLSGGEKQRVAIARALVNSPQIIFADEPTGNLDTASGKMVMQTLQDLHREGHTIILITHESSTAEHAERIISLKDGAIVGDTRVERRKDTREFIK
jgi:putative ABC transport system ATP-binding protein